MDHKLLKKKTPLIIAGLIIILIVVIFVATRERSEYARDFRNGFLSPRTRITLPEDPKAYLSRGDILSQLGQYKDAAVEYEKATEENPADPAAYLRLFELYQNYSPEPFKAELVFERALASGADTREILINYASFLEVQKRDLAKALETWLQAVEKTRSESERRAIELKVKELRSKLGLPQD